jgi:hypothetical protein
MTLDASGNLLVGDTTNPYSLGRLVIAHNSSFARTYFQRGVNLIEIIPSNGTLPNQISSSFTASGSAYMPLSLSARQNSADLYLATSGNVGIGTTTTTGLLTLGKTGGGQYIGALNTTNGYEIGYIQFNTDNMTINPQGGASGNDSYIRLLTAGTERMRITSDGTLDIKGNNNNVSGMNALTVRLGSNCNNTSSYGYVLETGGENRCFIYGNGNIVNTNNSYGALSDIKIKENIIDTTSKLADLLKIKVRNYNLIGDDKKQIGVIAQELETIFPSMVEVDGKSGMKQVKYSVFVPMIIKAMQEQQVQIEQLKNK